MNDDAKSRIEVPVGHRVFVADGRPRFVGEKVRFRGEQLGFFTETSTLDDARLKRKDVVYGLYRCPDGYRVVRHETDYQRRRERARWTAKEAMTVRGGRPRAPVADPCQSRYGRHLALAGLQGERALEGLLELQVRELHLAPEVQGTSRVALDERGERSAEAVVALERRVPEGDDLREKRVGPHEPAQRVPEGLLLPLLEGDGPGPRETDPDALGRKVERFLPNT